MNTETQNLERESLLDEFVFMEKSQAILDTGLKTGKNVVLYGPGGHGKSEFSLEFFYEKGLNPYIITMGTGMTTDRLFGGFNIPVLEKDGKIEYLVENSFMNHEFVIFEEMMDAPDFILEQLKDILSSGIFRNGTQVFPIKTRFIVACTNKTRDEFSKNASLKALMERFPLELNVIWDTYNETTYNTLLERRYGEGQVDPVIPFILQEYVKNGVIISPRIALDCYDIYQNCGPDSLLFIADFARKPAIIADALKKFESSIKFKQEAAEAAELLQRMNVNANRTEEQKRAFLKDYDRLKVIKKAFTSMTVSDDMAAEHAIANKAVHEGLTNMKDRYDNCIKKLTKDVVQGMEAQAQDILGTPQRAKKTKKAKDGEEFDDINI